MRIFLAAGSVLSLSVSLATSVFFFYGLVSENSFKLILLIASIAWFLMATGWTVLRKTHQRS